MTMSVYFFKCQFYNSLIPLSIILEGKGYSTPGEESQAIDPAVRGKKSKDWIQELVCVKEADFKRFLKAYNELLSHEASADGHLYATQADPGGFCPAKIHATGCATPAEVVDAFVFNSMLMCCDSRTLLRLEKSWQFGTSA